MWEQFDKFLKKQTTVASSFEKVKAHKFPTFAFCDSRGFNTRISMAGTAARYTETTFDVEKEVDLHEICLSDYDCKYPSSRWSNISVHMVPTAYNGYCKLFEFHEPHNTGTYAGEILFSRSKQNLINILWLMVYSRFCNAYQPIIPCFHT